MSWFTDCWKMALSFYLQRDKLLTKCRKLNNLSAPINWNISLIAILRRSGQMCQNIHSLWINWVTKAHGEEYIPLNRIVHGKHAFSMTQSFTNCCKEVQEHRLIMGLSQCGRCSANQALHIDCLTPSFPQGHIEYHLIFISWDEAGFSLSRISALPTLPPLRKPSGPNPRKST
jgi:hypothetical protein